MQAPIAVVGIAIAAFAAAAEPLPWDLPDLPVRRVGRVGHAVWTPMAPAAVFAVPDAISATSAGTPHAETALWQRYVALQCEIAARRAESLAPAALTQEIAAAEHRLRHMDACEKFQCPMKQYRLSRVRFGVFSVICPSSPNYDPGDRLLRQLDAVGQPCDDRLGRVAPPDGRADWPGRLAYLIRKDARYVPPGSAACEPRRPVEAMRP